MLELQQRDYLGNVRLTLSDRNADGAWEYTGRFDYYPFGMSRKLVDVTPSSADALGNRERFGGKEREVGLNMDDFGARWYEPGIGRWGSVDPLAGDMPGYSPYNYGFNNPVRFTDPTGMAPEGIETTIVKEEANGNYTVQAWVNDGKTDVVTESGELIGQSLTTHSFVDDDNTVVAGAVIDLGSTAGQDFIDTKIVGANNGEGLGTLEYGNNAQGGEPLDFKTNDIATREVGTTEVQYKYRGSAMADKTIVSARDVGNMAAGIVAGRSGLSWNGARMGFDAVQTRQAGLRSFLKNGPSTEALASVLAQHKGYITGTQLK